MHAGVPFVGMDKSVFDLLTPIKNFFQHSKVDKHKGVIRKQPIRTIIEVMRWFKLDPDGFITFWTGKAEKAKLFQRVPKFGPAPEDALKLLNRDKVFQEAVKGIVQKALNEAYNEFSAIVDKKLDASGQPLKQTDRQHMKDILLELMSRASEQVYANEQFLVTGKFAFTGNASDPHINADGVLDPNTHKAYFEDVVEYHDLLGLPYTQADLTRWGDPNGNREPVYWQMLHDWVGDDSLQRWLLTVKSQIEAPLLKEQLARGVYQNTDIWSKVKRGYTRKVFDVTEIQKTTGLKKYMRESSLGSQAKPQSTHKTFEEFVQAGEQEGWVPIQDYMTSMVDYAVDALHSIYQADTIANLHTVGAPFIHYRDEFRKVTPNNFVPKGHFTVIQYTHSPMIMAEAQRLSKALGKNVEPQAVLESLGFLQGKDMPGLVAWWKGAFQKPFVYRPVVDMFNTMFEKIPLGGISQIGIDIFNIAKHLKTLNPVDAAPVWVGLPYMRLSPVKVVTATPRAIAYSIKGLGLGIRQLQTGKQIETQLPDDLKQFLPLALMTG
jgi:hypothetical protein